MTKRLCDIKECGRPHRGRGYCNTHLLRLQRHGHPLVAKKAANGTHTAQTCFVPECDAGAKARGYCAKHYSRLVRHGDVDVRLKLGNGEASEQRKLENRRNARNRYSKTVHGRLRSRYANAKRRVLSGGGSAHISKHEFLSLWNSPLCGICSTNVSDADKSIDHIIPLARGGSNDLENMQIAHLVCNQRKNRFMAVANG